MIASVALAQLQVCVTRMRRPTGNRSEEQKAIDSADNGVKLAESRCKEPL